VRVRDGERLITDGPFMETKDHLLGFYLVDVADLDAALDWAARMPAIPGATIEVRSAMSGLGSGVINTLQRFGAACGIALVTAVFAAHGHLGSVSSFTAGYRPAMGVSAAISLLGAAAAVAIGRRQAAPVPAVVPERVPARRPG
jgi:YCII-related domain